MIDNNRSNDNNGLRVCYAMLTEANLYFVFVPDEFATSHKSRTKSGGLRGMHCKLWSQGQIGQRCK